MNKRIGFLLSVGLVLLTLGLNAQQWVVNAENEGGAEESKNFYEIQKSFNDYWASYKVEDGFYEKDGERLKAYGWKQFKRWEWFWESRVDLQTGAFPASSPYLELQKYREANPQLKSGNPNGNWTSMGPTSASGGYYGLGRLNCVAFHPNDNNIIYVGAAAGGIWKSTDAGASWVVLSDNNAVLGVSDIVVQDNGGSETIYIATGDRDGSDNYSVGVLKSTNGGLSWENTGLNWGLIYNRLISRLQVDPNNPEILYASTTAGFYKTVDGGANWTKLTSTYFIDFEFKPGVSNVIYGSTKTGGRVYRSIDGGLSWTQILASGGTRVEIAVSASNPEVLYALAGASNNGLHGVFKSTDGGSTFAQMVGGSPNMLAWECNGSDSGGQAWYDLCIAADPTNADNVFIGGVNTWASHNGGSTWEIKTHWWSTCGGTTVPVHADKHFLAFQNGSSTLYECNDGGLYCTDDLGSTYSHLGNGLVISQLYRLGVAQTSSAHVVGGLQDNGTKSLSNGTWRDVIGGDGMDCAIDPTDHNIQYGELYYGQIRRTINNWSSSSVITNDIPGSGAWVTPFALDPNNPSRILVGYQDVWVKDFDTGSTWTNISNLGQTTSLKSIAVAPSNSNVICAATAYNIYRTTNGGSTWTTIPRPANATMTFISIDSEDPDHFWVSFGQYVSHGVYETFDGGSTWNNISGGLPTIPVNCVIENKQNTLEQELYAATDIGVFIKLGSADWIPFMGGLPNVVVTELEIYYDANPSNSKMRAATFGRGLWESNLYEGAANQDVIVEFQIQSGSDDVEEKTVDGTMYSTSTDIELGDDPAHNGSQSEGLLFRNVTVPQGSVITSAYLEFQCDETSSGATIIDIKAEAADNALPFTSDAYNLTSRQRTISGVTWDIPAWNTLNEKHQTPDLSSVIQEVVGRPGWVSGSNMAIVITGTGTRTAEAFEGDPINAPKLHIEYSFSFSNPPVSDFAADPTTIKAGRSVQFTDLSTDIPTAWQWSFPGGTPSSSTEQHPIVNYSSPGVYDVSLTVSNPMGQDSKTLSSFITVNEPLPGESSFAVIGDFGSGTSNEAAVAGLVNSWNVDFIVTAGDNRYGSTNFDQVVGQYFCNFLKDAGSGQYCTGGSADQNRFFPSLGNHDYTDGGGLSEYLNYFTLPGNERYYNFAWGDVEFFVVDSKGALDNATDLENQKVWLQSVMEASTAVWKIVYFHHAAYSSGSHGSSAFMQWPFAEWGADAVIGGHDHNYERISYDGIVYFVNGAGGMSLYNFGTPVAGSEVRYNSAYGAMRVDVSPQSITFEFINTGGITIDTYTIQKTIDFTSNPVSLADATEDVNYSGDLSAHVEYNGNNQITYSIESGPAWLLVDPNTGLLSGMPGNDDVGQNNFSVKVDAGTDGFDQAELIITVINTNDAPVFNTNPIEGTAASENSAYSGSIASYASDIDGDNLIFSKVSGPSWLTVNVDGSLSGTPGFVDRNENQWIVRVSDGNGGTDDAQLNIFVYPVNIPPEFISDPFTKLAATEDAPYSSSIASDASDADLDNLTFAKVSGPSWLQVAPGGQLSGTPVQSDVQLNSFIVSANDGKGGVTEATMLINVINVNDAPVFTNALIIKSGAPMDVPYSESIAGEATDEDGTALVYTKVTGPAWLNISQNGGLSGTPLSTDVGLNVWTVMASDGELSATAQLQIEVLFVNTPPEFTTNPVIEINANEDFAYESSLADNVYDPDAQSLTFNKISGPAWLLVSPSGNLTGTPQQADVGLNPFVVTVDDGNGGSDQATVEIMVNNTNDIPVFATSVITRPDGVSGSEYFDLISGEASDEDNDPISYSIIAGPAWLSCLENGSLSGMPVLSDEGLNQWTVQADDNNGGIATATLEIVVIAPASYCEPSGWTPSTEYISSVVFDGVPFSSGQGSGYDGLSPFTFTFDANTAVNYSLVPGFVGRASFQYWNVWIDYDKSGIFESDELVISSDKKKNTLEGSFITGSIPGLTRMRISMSDAPGALPCSNNRNGEVEDYLVNIIVPGPQPPIADFTVSQTQILPGTSVNFTDLSINSPENWSWNFGNGQTSSVQNPSVTYNNIGTYSVSLLVSNAYGSDEIIKAAYIVVSEDVGSTYCEPIAIDNAADYIASLSISGISGVNGPTASGYMKYDAPVFDMATGANVNVSLSPFDSRNRNFWRIWIDFNGDGDFEDIGETVLTGNNKKGTFSSSFTVPADASGGPTRMRVTLRTGSSPSYCDDGFNGEVVDYDVNIFSSGIRGGNLLDENADAGLMELNIFPNPVNEILTLKTGLLENEADVRIHNLLGQDMMWIKLNADYSEINVSTFEKGIYFLSFTYEDRTIVRKFVKN